MAIYRIAGEFFEMDPESQRLKKQAEKYLYKGEVPGEVTNIDIPAGRIEENRKKAPNLSRDDIAYIGYGARFARKLLRKDGFVLHSSAVAYEGNAYLFSADSGTGKSTHTAFWQDCFGKDKAVIINDDKPALIERNGIFYAAGTPFSGKTDLSEDITVPVKALCFIYRSEKNEIRKLDVSEILDLIMAQAMVPPDREEYALFLEILDRFLKKVPIYSFGVTYSAESARFVYEYLKNN